MSQNERLKWLRKHLGLTLDSFGEKIGIKKSALSLIENGKSSLTEQTIKSICREYNVSDQWLRNGEGDPFIKLDLEDEVAALMGQVAREPDGSFKKKLLAVLANLTEEQWELLADMAQKFAEK